MQDAQCSVLRHDEEAPEIVYHYCSMESFVKIIESKEIWLTPSTHINDVVECRWLYSLAHEFAQKHFADSPEDASAANALLHSAALNSRRNYMTCFSRNGDLLSQWRSYADACKGVAIGFRSTSFGVPVITQPHEHGPRQEQFCLCKMLYVDYEDVLPLLDEMFKQAKDNEPELQGILLASLGARFKNKSFLEEDEWRLVVEPFLLGTPKANHWTSGIIDIDSFKTRVTGRGLSKYIAYPILGEGQAEIAEVVLGPQNLTWEDDLSFFLFKNGLPCAKILRSESTFRG